MGVNAEGMLRGFARVNQVTSAFLGYPLSVFNKNSQNYYRIILCVGSDLGASDPHYHI